MHKEEAGCQHTGCKYAYRSSVNLHFNFLR